MTMITIFSFQFEYKQVVNSVQSVRNVFITFLFLMSFCAYAGSCAPFEAPLQSNPAAQLETSFAVVQSNAEQYDSLPGNVYSQEKTQLKHDLTEQKTTASRQALNTPIKLLNQKFPAPKEQRKLKDGKHVDPGLNRNSYLLSEYQRQPVYQLEIEFNPPLPPTQKSASSLAVNDYRPWFLSNHGGNPARISGWKQSNSLYSASITYHS